MHNYKVGVGVTTTPKRNVSQNVYVHSNPNTRIIVNSDVNGEGVSKSRNKLLSQLDDCDFIFLFDDDCYPVMCGWEDYFINIALKHNVNHMALVDGFKTGINKVDGELAYWDGAIGAFSFQTKLALDTVGGFNTRYERYGYEDAARTLRVNRSGINPSEHPFPIRGLMYIHSEDVFAENPPVNLSHDEKLMYIEKNRLIYEEEINNNIHEPYK